jgi:uncharacterized protein YecT (DUF1311 family)
LECRVASTRGRELGLTCLTIVNGNRLRALRVFNPDSIFAAPPAGSKGICPDAATTLAIRQCTDTIILQAQERLRRLVADVRRGLPNSVRATFDSAGRAWTDYTMLYCQSLSDLLQGGTLAPFVTQTCIKNFADERRAVLEGLRPHRG